MKKYNQTLSINSTVISDVLIRDGCADINSEKTGRVKAIKYAFFLDV